MMKKISVVLVATYAFSCHDEQAPTDPPEPPPPKDPRSYEWTIDTIAYPESFQTSMNDIWASSPTDVWIVGHNERGFGKMFHYDGETWVPDDRVPVALGPIDLSEIIGFSRDNVFAVGEHIDFNPEPPPNFIDSTLIIHFDGVEWDEIIVDRAYGLSSIGGNGPDDIWTAGRFGSVYHFDGNIWVRDSLPPTFSSDTEWFVNSIAIMSDGTAYMLANGVIAGTPNLYHRFLARHSSTWVVVDSFEITPENFDIKWGTSALWTSPSDQLYSCGGGGVFRWNGSSWDNILPGGFTLGDIFGLSDSHIFTVGLGRILFYDGESWTELDHPGDRYWSFPGVWCNQEEVFIVGNDGYVSYVLHGK